jgi:hypothetical protein
VKRLAVAAVLSVSLLALAGCETAETIETRRREVEREKKILDATVARTESAIGRMDDAVADLSAERDRLAALAARLDPSSPDRVAIEGTISETSSRIASIRTSIDDAERTADDARARSDELADALRRTDEILASANGPNAGTEIGSVIGMIFPGAATLAPFLAGAAYRASRLARAKSVLEREVDKKTVAIDRIVASIDALATISPAVRDAMTTNARVIDTIQTPVGKTAVDEAQVRNVKKVV